MVLRDKVYPFFFRISRSCTAVVSSSNCIWLSTIAFISSWTFECLPDPDFLPMTPDISFLLRNLWIPYLLHTKPSCNIFLAIEGPFRPLLCQRTICLFLYSEKTVAIADLTILTKNNTCTEIIRTCKQACIIVLWSQPAVQCLGDSIILEIELPSPAMVMGFEIV
jgi:hypothetical protein